MRSPLDLLLFAPRLAMRLADDVARFADAAESAQHEIELLRQAVDGVHQEVTGVRRSTQPLPDNTARMAESFDRSNDELRALRQEMRPMITQVDETADSIASIDAEFSDVAEPLRPAAERVGKLAQRVPGKTKPDGD
jgi:methyl-accepting chemotaxis protein